MLDNLGKSDVEGGRSPFKVNFVISDASSKHPMDRLFYKCNESVPRRHLDLGGAACSCSDCESSCPAPPKIPPEFLPIKILG